MGARLVGCTKCRAPLPPDFYNVGDLRACPSCAVPLQIEVFPAALRPVGRGSAGEAVMIEGEASCFYHPAKKAVVPCESCGRFLCAVCDVELSGQHLCPACVESGRKKGRLQQLDNRRTLYDNLALAAAVYPLLFVWTTLIGAPIALYLAIRYWGAPSSVIPRSKWRFVLAILLALAELGTWAAVLIVIANKK